MLATSIVIFLIAYAIVLPIDKARNNRLDSQPRLGKRTPHKYLNFRNIATAIAFSILLGAYKGIVSPAMRDAKAMSLGNAVEVDMKSIEAKLAYAAAVEAAIQHIKLTKSLKTPRMYDFYTIDQAKITTDGMHYIVNASVGGTTNDDENKSFWFRYECILARDKSGAFSSLGVSIKGGYIR
jgi:hypothetical protein